ncbi:ribonucleoside triphosphate reductase [bacterium]|nr:ribonucleoside triphosphate reductase [bacterium]
MAKKHKKINLKILEIKKIVEDYIKKKTWKVKENSNQRFSYSSVSWRLAGEVITRYTLSEIYPKKISNAHLNGDLHIHNLYMGICGYCAGWSIQDLLMKGVGIPWQVTCAPPKHFNSALNQLANFFGIVSNEWAGAQAINSLDIFLAPFVRKDGLSYKEVKQAIQGFIYTLNLPTRYGGQTPFTNITFDLKIPDDLADKPVIIGGKIQKECFKEFQPEVDMINKAFMEVMLEGDSQGRAFTFPIPTYNITKDFDWSSPITDLMFEMTAKYGIPYFQNFIRSDLDPHAIRSMCCHLKLDLTKLKYRRVGGYFGYADKTGSVSVVTINMPRIGYLAKNEEDFFRRLEKLMDIAKESLEIKRKVVTENMKSGLLPFTQKYLGTLKYHFSTIGLVGMNEACLNFLGKDITTEEGKKFAIKVLKFMRNKLVKYQKETGNVYNLEATPAESTAYRLARIDKECYPKIKTAGEKTPYYTNSTLLPVNYTDDLFKALKHQNDLQTLYTGGTVFHIFLGERIGGKEAKILIKKVLENYDLPYITLTPTFSVCPEHGYLKGEQFKCPKCGRTTEVYSRTVGFLTPVQNWNIGKKEEFRQRKEYKYPKKNKIVV